MGLMSDELNVRKVLDKLGVNRRLQNIEGKQIWTLKSVRSVNGVGPDDLGNVTVSGGGGSGTVTSVGSTDGSVTVTNPTTTPNLSVSPSSTSSATIYVTTAGNDSSNGLTWNTAKATITAALGALPTNGGIVQLGYGTFNVSSSARTDTGVSYSAGTWTDSSIVSADVGSYVLGTNINNAEVPKILTVTNGVSFTTDIAPAGSVTSQSVLIVSPAFVLPPGVQIRGIGSAFSPTNNSTTTAGTKVLDGGSGITCLIRGGSGTSTTSLRYGMRDLAIQGNSNSTTYGLYIGNFAWFFTASNCDFSHHGVAGVAADGNINSDSFYDCTFRGNGTFSSSTFTGGVITHPYYITASSSLNFYNCFFDNNYGWGLSDAQATGATAVCLYNCQFNATQTTSATGSGTSLAITDHQNGSDGKAFIIGGWSESANLYDIDAYGSPTIINFTCASSAVTNHLRVTGGTTQLIGCRFENAGSVASITLASGGVITWNGTTCNDSFFYSGCGFTNGNIPPAGSSFSTQANKVIFNGSNSGQTNVQANSAASGVLTLPAATDTLVGKATTDTLTNKTITSSTNNLGGVTAAFGSDATGDIYYNNGGVLARLAIGSGSQVLGVSSGKPSWVSGGSGSGITRSVNSVSTATAAGATASTDYVYLVTGTTTVTLPTAVSNTNLYTIKNVGSATVTIATTSAQTIDGSSSVTLPVQYTSLDLISDGSNWNVV